MVFGGSYGDSMDSADGGASLLQQGLDAYQSGDKVGAARLFKQAIIQNQRDENAWLYLAMALDDPEYQRRAFQQVLMLDSNNVRAQKGLADLDRRLSGGKKRDARPKADASASNNLMVDSTAEPGFALPIAIDGAPERITQSYVTETAKERLKAVAVTLLSPTDTTILGNYVENATRFDALFVIVTSILFATAAEFIGRFVGSTLGFLVRGTPFGRIITSPIFGALAILFAIAAGYAIAVYASKFFLDSEKVPVEMPRHTYYIALGLLPGILLYGVLSLLTNALGLFIACLLPVGVLGLAVLLMYTGYLLYSAFSNEYGRDNNRSLYVTLIALAGGWIGALFVRAIAGVLFRNFI